MEEPIVVTETYDVRPGSEADFYSWGAALIQAVARSDNYLGGDVRDPEWRDGEWQIVHRWADRDAAREWEESSSRERWIAAVASFVRPHSIRVRAARAPATARFPPDDSPPVRARESPLVEPREQATSAPPVAPPSPPPKWKMAIVTLMAVFPPVLFFNVTLIPQLRNVSVVLRTLILCIAVTPVVTWIMMPRLQRLLKRWLTGDRRPRGRAGTIRAGATRTGASRIGATRTSTTGTSATRIGATMAGVPPSAPLADPDAEPVESFPRFRPATVPAGDRDGRAAAPSARAMDLDAADPYLRRSR